MTSASDAPMHLNEDLEQRRHRNAPVVTPLQLCVYGYFEWYPTCFHVGHFCGMQTDGNDLQVWDHLGECRDIDVTDWAKRWNCWVVAVPSAVISLGSRRIRLLYAVTSKWISSAD